MSFETQPIPQPPPKILIGHLLDIDPKSPGTENVAALAKKYGEIYKVDIIGRVTVLVSSQKMVHEVCDQAGFGKIVWGSLAILRDLAGDGLFTAHQEEEVSAVAHRILVPGFSLRTIRGMFGGMKDIATQLITTWSEHGEKLDATMEFTKFALDSVALCTFGYRFDSFQRDEPHPFVQALSRTLEALRPRSRRIPGSTWLGMYRKEDRIYEEDIALQHRIADEVIEARMKDPTEDDDLLNKMIHGVDSKTGMSLTKENIRYQLVTFLIAGHETTSGMLSFLFYYLLKSPRDYQAIRDEVDSVCGSSPVEFEHLRYLKYLDASLKETLRLRPTVPGWTVSAKADTLLDGKYVITKGQAIFVILETLHKDPTVWGDDAEEFYPGRMLYGKFEALPPDSWKPFGNGSRSCIGRPFAWQESLLVVAMIFQEFDVEMHDPAYKMKINPSVTIRPAEFYIRVSPRQNRPGQVMPHSGGTAEDPD